MEKHIGDLERRGEIAAWRPIKQDCRFLDQHRWNINPGHDGSY